MQGTYFDGPTGRQALPNVIFVEGKDDALFIDILLLELGANPNCVGVCYVDGKDNFERALGVFLKTSAFISGTVERYAVIRDADDNFERTLKAMNKTLRKLKEPVFDADNFTVRDDGRRIGLFIVPDHQTSGDLERLCISTVNEGDLGRFAQSYIIAAQERFGVLKKESKRIAQAYLAICPGELCSGVGLGSKNGAFNIRSQKLISLTNFLRQLL